jgi:Zn-dependent peptidase ImmA (M78 family)
MHEIAHVIFDLESEQVSIDYKEDASEELKELRAQTFAQEALVPRSVLVQIANRFGLNWSRLSAEDIATLIAHSHVEQQLVLKAAFEAELISPTELETYRGMECAADLRQLTPHALNTREFLRAQSVEMPKWVAENRNTDIGRRSLRLPALYVSQVLDALKSNQISEGKAAEMLMMERETLRARFGSLIESNQPLA